MTFLILVCSRCGGYLLAKDEHKTRTCPYCGATIPVYKAKKVATAKTAFEASTILRELKARPKQKQRNLSPREE